CTREDEGFSCEDLRLRSIAGGRGWFDAEMDQFTDHCPVPRLVEVREDSLRHRLADASDHRLVVPNEILVMRLRQRFEAAELSCKVLGGGRAHVRDAEAVDEAPQFGAFAGLDRGKELVGRLFDALAEREQVVTT